MAAVDFATCEQPDELILLAWNAGFDRKAVIREGSDAAQFLLPSGERAEVVILFWPVPRPLEAVDLWAGNPALSSRTSERIRPYASAVVPGCVLGSLISHFFVAPHLSESSAVTALAPIIVASIAVLGVVFKVLIDAALRRRAARLDEERALSIVLVHLRRGMAARPRLVPYAVKGLRRGLQMVATT